MVSQLAKMSKKKMYISFYREMKYARVACCVLRVVFLTARTRISDSREVAKTRSWKKRTRVIREMGQRREKEPSLSLAPVCFWAAVRTISARY